MKIVNKQHDFPGSDSLPAARKKAIGIIRESSMKKDELRQIFKFLDITSLNASDTKEKIIALCRKMNEFPSHFPSVPEAAAFCVYPCFVETVRKYLKRKNVHISVAGGGFPASQTFITVKMAECRLAIERGAGEVDVVLQPGLFLEKNYATLINEMVFIRQAVKNSCLKVILETGLLKTPQQIYEAAYIAMETGADFIKTSTGTIEPGATEEAVYIIAHAIKNYYKKTGKKTGIKPAGGISTVQKATGYYQIVKAVLGKKWLTPQLFRIGASRLANNLLAEIMATTSKKNKTINYF